MTVFLKYALAAGALAALSSPSFALPVDSDDTVVTGEREDLVSINVYYSDLNLASDADVARLGSRVRSAARQICISSGRQPLSVYVQERKCLTEAMDGAEPQIEEAVRNYGSNVAARAIAVSRKKG